MKTTAERVKEIMSSLLMVDEEELTSGANLTDDLGADSLDRVELIMELETEFDLQVDDDDMDRFQTVKDVVEYVEGRVGK